MGAFRPASTRAMRHAGARQEEGALHEGARQSTQSERMERAGRGGARQSERMGRAGRGRARHSRGERERQMRVAAGKVVPAALKVWIYPLSPLNPPYTLPQSSLNSPQPLNPEP